MGQTVTAGGSGHYPDVDRTVIAVAKEFAARVSTGLHAHERAQLIFAVQGLMLASTDAGQWLIPRGFALWVPVGTSHNVVMHGAVSMRTAYVRVPHPDPASRACRVLKVTPLLEAALVELCNEPAAYEEHRRGGHLAAIILDEVRRAPETPFALPMPGNARLAAVVRDVIAHPASRRDIDHWADALGMSRRTFTRLFRSNTGLSFAEWRCRVRLLAAAQLISKGETLSKAAASVGYASTSAFAAMARRELGAEADKLLDVLSGAR